LKWWLTCGLLHGDFNAILGTNPSYRIIKHSSFCFLYCLVKTSCFHGLKSVLLRCV
jgi:hypothetical protein